MLQCNFQIFESTKPLRIGFYTTDGYIKAVPACERAVLMAKAALEKRGHTVSNTLRNVQELTLKTKVMSATFLKMFPLQKIP